MKRLFDIVDLKGKALDNAVNNMRRVLLEDNNEITNIEEITLQRIFDEIDSCEIKFNKKGDIVL